MKNPVSFHMPRMRSLLAVLFPLVAGPLSAADKPNVLFIAVDDLVPTLGCYGDTAALTPQIDSLASQGMTFLNHHCQWAVCGPSRAALTTSLMPEETGVMGFRAIRHPDALPDVITLPQHFKNEGYETACTGKFHDPRTVGDTAGTLTNDQFPDGQNIDDPLSWSVPFVKAASGYSPAGKPAVDDSATEPFANYGDHHIKEEGLALIDALSAGSKPFFLAVGFKKPHLGFYAPRQFWDLYDPNSLPEAPFTTYPAGASSYTNSTLDFHSELQGYEPYDTSWPPSAAQARELVHGYYACVSMIDALVGNLLDKLAATPDPVQAGKMLNETTIVVLWGDHGFHLGDHGRWGKHTNMEQGTRCPLIIFDPRSPTAPGTNSTTSPANTIDIYPTLCELAGLPIPDQPESNTVTTGRPLRGRSLVPVLDEPSAAVHHGAITHFNNGGQYGYAYRTERFRYIEWVSSGGAVNGVDLYDYTLDPLETRNLAADPAYAAIVHQLSRSMRAETTTNGAARLNLAVPAATGGDAFLPFTTIAMNGSDVTLDWPSGGGVSYHIIGSATLDGGSWGDDLTNITGSPATFPASGPRRFFRIGFGENSPPVFSADPLVLPDAQVDAPYAGTLAGLASDADAGQALVFSKLAGPGWLTVTANGALSGTPLAAEEEAAYFTIGVEDPLGATARATLQITVGTTPPPVTGIELVTQLDVSGSSPLFGTTYFSGITVQAGDLLVVAHSNNKNTTTNTISLTGLGTNVVQDVNSGSSGTQSSAWVFSSAITETGTFDLALDTSNATKTVSQSTSLFVLRPTNGGSLAIASSTSNVAGLPGVTSLDLAFTMSPAVTDAFGIAAATANAVGFDSVPSGWSMEANGNDKRRTFSNAAISGASHTATFTAATETDMALAGIVVKAVSP